MFLQNKKYYQENKDRLKNEKLEYYRNNKDKTKEYNNSFVTGLFASRSIKKLTIEEQPEINEDGILTCICNKCKTRFTPTVLMIKSRIQSLEGKRNDNRNRECRLYCCEECKNTCEIYGKRWNELTDLERHIQDELRYYTRELKQMVIERDGSICQYCHSTDNLEMHHIKSVRQNSMLASDIDNLILFCNDCHRNFFHQMEGCTLPELKCSISY